MTTLNPLLVDPLMGSTTERPTVSTVESPTLPKSPFRVGRDETKEASAKVEEDLSGDFRRFLASCQESLEEANRRTCNIARGVQALTREANQPLPTSSMANNQVSSPPASPRRKESNLPPPTSPPSRKEYQGEKGNTDAPNKPSVTVDFALRSAAKFRRGTLEEILFTDLQNEDGHQVTMAAEELEDILIGKWDKCEEFHNLGGHSVLLLVMRKWQDNPDVQGSCFRCISTLLRSYHPKNNNKRKLLIAFLVKMKATELIFEALAKFQKENDPMLFLNGFAALSELILTGFWPKNGQRKAHEAMVTVILKSMANYPQYNSLQRYGCSIISRFMSLNLVDHAPLHANGCLRLLIAAAQRYPSDHEMKQEIFVILKALLGPNASGLLAQLGDKEKRSCVLMTWPME